VIRLETPTRYYLLAVQRDLFGRWEVWRAWGAKGSALGNHMRQPADSADEAHLVARQVLALRIRRGYKLTLSAGTGCAGAVDAKLP
jgi:predicted DNA-binding WGR domain protein